MTPIFGLERLWGMGSKLGLVIMALGLFAAAPAEPTLAQRKRFAEKHPMKLALELEGGGDCVKVMAPAELGCSAPAWVCPRSWASAMCTGSFSKEAGVTFALQAPSPADLEATPLPMLVLDAEAGEECPECQCAHDLNFLSSSGATEAQRAREFREFQKLATRLHAQCIRETVARQKAERSRLQCSLLMVDPCRQEAFIRCTGQNVGLPLRKTLHFSFAPQPDGGAPRGGGSGRNRRSRGECRSCAPSS